MCQMSPTQHQGLSTRVGGINFSNLAALEFNRAFGEL